MTNASLTAIICLICGINSSSSFLLSHPRNTNFCHQLAQDTPCCVLNCLSDQTENRADLSVIEHFLSLCNDCNEQYPDSVRIISRKSSHDPPNVIVKESVFNSVDNSKVYITLTRDLDGLDELKLQSVIGNEMVLTAPKDMKSLIGVPPTAVPPFGHVSNSNTTIIVDEVLVDSCRASNAMIVGSAVHPYWQCLMTCDTLLSLPNIQVADICAANMTETCIPPTLTTSSSALATFSSPDPPKPAKPSFLGFFPGDVPPTNIAALVVNQRSLSNPLVPTTIKIIGSLGTLEKKTKKLATTYLFPLGDNGIVSEEPLSWRTSSDGETFNVRLVFGRTLLQSLGQSQWDAILDSLKAGQVVDMTTQTRVIDRDSLCKWVEDQCLELEVKEFRMLSTSNQNENGPADTGQLQIKHRPKSEWTTPQFAPLTINDVLGHDGTIEVVDSVESLQSFVTETAGLQSLTLGASNTSTLANLMGIDCEWQPNQLSPKGEKQPVILLQISLHALQKVYLLDLQTLLRPLLEPNEPMNQLEASVSKALTKLFQSTSIIKVGYQVSSDLVRVAASYPHLPCFQQVASVLELDGLVKRTLQLLKQKKSRAITTSLAKLTSHYLQKTIDKECQVSNWSARPLTQEQLEYAALDAAIGPVLAQAAMESINATLNTDIPRVERWQGDEGFCKVMAHVRLTHFDQDVTQHERVQLQEYKATQVFGLSWTVSQNWIVGKHEPPVPTLS